MAHYAFLNDNNIVTEVITGIDEDVTEGLPEGFADWEAWYADFRGQTCKRTSYNTMANAHRYNIRKDFCKWCCNRQCYIIRWSSCRSSFYRLCRN